VFAIGAERRIVLSQTETTKRLFCSEPPPDVAQSFADSVRAALQIAAQQQATFNRSNQAERSVTPPDAGASAPATNQSGSQQLGNSEGASVNGNLSLARDFATSISQIYTRSQGVQLFRDGAFMLCQAHLNHALRGDRIEEQAQVEVARFKLAQQFQLLELNPSIAPLDNSKAAAQTPSAENLDRAKKALPDPPDMLDLNYSAKFTQLLNTVHSVLLAELPNLYRYDVERAKQTATDAATRAVNAKTQVTAAAAAASASEISAGQMRNLAAQSAAQAVDASASAAASSTAARASADAAAAAATKTPVKAAEAPASAASTGGK